MLQDIFRALEVQPQQLLPLEVESLHCGGNASCSKKLVDELGLQPARVIVVQVCECKTPHLLVGVAMGSVVG